MSWQDDVIQQVREASRPGFDNKADAVAYYQREYPHKGKGGWKQRLIHGLLPFTPRTGKDPAKNLAKRFEKRLSTAEPKNRKQYQNLALSLGLRKPPKKGYHVHFDGKIFFSTCEDRTFDINITGDLAQELCDHPEDFERIIMLVYMQEEGEDEPSAWFCPDDKPYIAVTANRDDARLEKPKARKSSRPFMKR
jgi:hypothetical protein